MSSATRPRVARGARLRGRLDAGRVLVRRSARLATELWRERRTVHAYVGQTAGVADESAVEWVVRVAKGREALARLTERSVLGSPREDVERVIGLFRPVDTGRSLIRLGPGGDGSYLVPDDLDGVSACFSPGVSDSATFEEALVRRGVRCFLADRSVSAPPVANDMFDFEPVFLGVTSRPGWTTLADWVERKAPEGDLMLQMDIEGSEWAVLAQAEPELLRRFRILVLELHGMHGLHERQRLTTIEDVWRKVLDDFAVVHLHPNNYELPVRYQGLQLPPALEVTLLRRDRVAQEQPVARLPHSSDTPNTTALPDVALSAEWYR